jgi:uncharacterized Zn-binding protein involved in type VI secretion
MPGIARKGVDTHIGHASTTFNPFHKTPYTTAGQTKVKVNGSLAVVAQGGRTACGDPAVGGSTHVTIQGRPAHRIGDATGGHGSWFANACASGSGNVIAHK